MTDIKEIQQGNDLKNIGSILRKKREDLSYTLEHVSEITRITLTCLRNIEEGNMKALPGLVFVRGFIRNYAKLLGLESDWMIEALNQSYVVASDVKVPGSEHINRREDHGTHKSSFFYYSLLIGIVCVILLVVYVVYKLPSDRLSLSSETVETVQAVDSQVTTTITPEKTLPGQVANPTNQKPAATQPAPPVISPLTLTLVALDNDWIRLAIDQQDPFELKLKKGEKYEWPAQDEYALVMTTGSTATVHLNGEEITERESFLNQLFQVKLNKFTLKQINNRQ